MAKNNNLISDSEKAKSLGLSYGVYMQYKENGTIENYMRRKFLETSKRNADNSNVYESSIGSCAKDKKIHIRKDF